MEKGPDKEAERAAHRNAGNAALAAVLPALLGAFFAKGWFGGLDGWFALMVSVTGAPFAGALIGRDRADKVFSAIAAMIGGLGVAVATLWFVGFRGREMGNVELLLPIAVGGLPGLAAFYAFRALEPQPLARTLVAFLASVLTLVFIAAS